MTREFIDLSNYSKEEAKVLIAKDVLKQIAAKRIIASTGRYISIDNLDEDNNYEQLHEVLESTTVCEVCALGSLIYSRAMVANKISSDVMDGDDLDWDSLSILEQHFTAKELTELEYLFELGDWGKYAKEISVERKQEISGVREKLRLLSEEDRLIKLMSNIIDNNGNFVPEAL